MEDKEQDNWTPPTPVVANHWGLIDFDSSFSQLSTNGYKIAQKKYLPQGKHPIIDQGQELIGGFTDEAEKVLANSKNSIVFGDHTRCFKLINFSFAPGADGTKILKPISSIDLKFAYYALQTVRLPNRGYSRHFSFLRKSVLPFCHPNEQKRVVAKIEELFSELDKGVESLKTARAQLKIYRQAVLKHAFEGKLTAQWREDNKDRLETADELLERIQNEREARYQQQLEDWKISISAWEEKGRKGRKPTKPSKLKALDLFDKQELEKLGSIPENWVWVKYTDFCSIIRNGISKKPVGDVGDKIFRISAVRAMFFDMNDYRIIENNNGEFDNYYLQKHDVVFTRYNGSRRYVGVGAEYTSNEARLFPDKLIQTRPDLPSVNPSYIERAVNSGASRKFVESKIRTTAGQSGVSGSDIKSIPIPFCNLEEQQEILLYLDSQLTVISRFENDIEQNLTSAEALRQSILKKAFSGKLVAQDPNDEPASVLLERIKAEKNNNKKKGKAA